MFPEKRSALLQISNRWYHLVLQPLFDLMGLVAAWRITLDLRLFLNPLMSLHFSRSEIVRLAPPLSAILLLWIVVLPCLGLYRREPDRSVGTNLLRIARFAIISSILTVVAATFSHRFGQDLSRSLVILFAPVSFVMLMAARSTELFVCAAIDEVWPVRERLAVVGEGPAARRIVDGVRRARNGATTGLWQISGRSDTSFEQMTELDVDYIRNRSLKLDLKILLVTPLVVMTGRGAY